MAKLEGLDARKQLSPDWRQTLGQFYFQDVASNYVGSFTDGTVGFNSFFDWRKRVDSAIALNPEVRAESIDLLVRLASQNIGPFRE